MKAVKQRNDSPGTLIDAVMPEYEHHERHETLINASIDDVRRAIRDTTPGEIRFLGLLTAVRGLRRPAAARPKPVLEAARESGFCDLAGNDAEQVFGLVGQFWRLRPRACTRRVAGADAFRDFDEPGFAKAAVNFLMVPEGEATRLITETRVATTDARSRRRFGIYWRLISPGSALIRREWLRAIRLRAETGTPL